MPILINLSVRQQTVGGRLIQLTLQTRLLGCSERVASSGAELRKPIRWPACSSDPMGAALAFASTRKSPAVLGRTGHGDDLQAELRTRIPTGLTEIRVLREGQVVLFTLPTCFVTGAAVVPSTMYQANQRGAFSCILVW